MDAAKGAWQDVSHVLGKLTKSTGKAAWIAGTAFLILLVPLIIEMDREQQLVEFENQQLGALTGPSSTTPSGTTAPVSKSKLPHPVREMGDRYVREEFASHLQSNDTTESQWQSFFQEWRRYHGMLAGSADFTTPDGTMLDQGEALITGIDQSGDISEDIIKQMTPEQIERLQSIRKEAVKFGQELISTSSKPSSSSSKPSSP
ncbi:putative Mitochondrial import receptor subunit TOM9-2 [Nannochloris sp. 'desiccata']|nr:hypothetical protein KSW81_003869 [Chlorella desiccata (nom. nud.)]KAH7624370.1 putative Mitochondrial import receptor subunit TOM9-2 [Chlorella desiccata (nom. nud.)]